MKNNIIFIMLLSTILAGCATKVVSSNPRSVIVESEMMEASKAQELADIECKKHNRYAKMTTKADFHDRNYVFDCVQ